jgi:F-type H+-transporting ATPase subunit b
MDEKRETWQAQLAQERADFARAVQEQAARELIEITEDVLQDFADADLADRVSRTFVARLENLEEARREKLAQAARDSDEPARVETASPLPAEAKRRLTRAIHDGLSTDLEVQYAETADLVLGVRLAIGDQTVEWSVRRYLDRLENAMTETLKAGGPVPEAAQQTEGADTA